ncbi:TonB-dependent receptor domain-containing protein [Flavobacterium sp. JP2137]|uniref:TonB-dependent receptor domain-containing protein n=1 Tax=Flavobacterium sp. JP2137 TaxID=3414510 RepID=UPI003D2FD495
MKCLKLFLCLMVFAVVSPLSAQHHLRGSLYDLKQQPLDFGDIRLVQSDTDRVYQTYTDSLGTFDFADLSSGIYVLQLVEFGNIQEQRELQIDSDIDLGTFSLSKTSQLSEIVIQGKKKLYESKIDRTVFNVEQSLLASSGDALDALKATPGVSVTHDDIKIIGKSSISVLINDKLVQLSGEDLNTFLKTLSASDIEKIEVITTPPAKYEAQGNNGLVNIVLKPRRANAWNNSTRLNYYQASYANFKFGNTFTYSKDKLSAQVNLDLGDGYHSRIERLTNVYPDETWISVDPERTQGKQFGAKINLEYQFTKKSSLNVQYMKNNYDRETIWNYAHTDVFDQQQQRTSEVFTSGHSRGKDRFENFNLGYDYKMDTLGKKLRLDLDYFSNDKYNTRPFESEHNYVNTALPPSLTRATSNGDIDIDVYSAKLDFEHPMKAFKLDYGAKVNWIKTASDSKYFDRISGQPIADPSKSDCFDYKEQGQALYLSATKDWTPKWSSQLGLRMEATQNTGTSHTLAQTQKKSFLDFFPTVYLQYKPTENHSISLNYNKRISRPSFWALNPFRWYIDAYSYSEGNPFLEPFNTHKVALSYTYKNNWNTKVEYSRTTNAITQVQNINEIDKTRNFTQENFYNVDSYAFNQSYTFSNYPWWQSINALTVTWSRSTLNDDIKQVYQVQNGANAFVSSNNSFKITPQLAVEANGYFSSKTHYMIYKVDPSANLDLGVSYKMLDEQLKFSLNVYDVFRTSASKVYTNTGEVQTTFNNYYDNRYANLSLTYSFGNKNIKAQKTQSGDEEARNRM